MFVPIVFLLLFSGCVFKDGKYVQDNPVEEIAEAVIDAGLGVDFDLTPGSPE
jgi:hypothetical protein